MEPNIIFLGGGNHAKVVYEAKATYLSNCGFYDNNQKKAKLHGFCTLLGPLEDVLSGKANIDKSAQFICVIGDNEVRKRVVEAVKLHYPDNKWYTAIAPSAHISKTAKIGDGCMILTGAIVHSEAQIGDHCILNSNCVVEHDCTVESFAHIAPSATLCGEVFIGEGCFIGVGAKVIPRTVIECWTVIGAGITVLWHTPDHVTVTQTWKGLPKPLSRTHAPAWLPPKSFDSDAIHGLLSESIARNHFANNGPAVQDLEVYVRKLLKIKNSKALIAVNNATAGLHAVVDAWRSNGAYEYVTQAFTFPASAQGPLRDAKIVDVCPLLGGLDVKQIEKIPAGIIVTNVFGLLTHLNSYEEYARRTGCKLLFDNAATPWSFWNNVNACNFGNAAVISFHHTKPLGFGEGGMIIIDKEDEAMVRRIINFGYDVPKGDEVFLSSGSNYKMSDVSAAFILAHLKTHAQQYRLMHQEVYRRFQFMLRHQVPGAQILPHFQEGGSFPFLSCLPVLFPKPVSLQPFKDQGLYVRKYYKPLSLDREKYPVAWDWYDRIICFPVHEQVSWDDLEKYIQACQKVIA